MDINNIDQIIDGAIEALSDDRIDTGVENLYELAILWKSAGMDAASFSDICGYIEREAAAKSDETFVQVKIQNALIRIREQKHGKILLRPIH